MSGLAWIRLDTGWPRNRKVLQLLGMKGGDHAIVVYVASLCLAGEQGSDGFINDWALPTIHGKAADARLLVDVELWHQVEGGWQVNDWNVYQESNEETQKRSLKAKRAAARRWEKASSQPF